MAEHGAADHVRADLQPPQHRVLRVETEAAREVGVVGLEALLDAGREQLVEAAVTLSPGALRMREEALLEDGYRTRIGPGRCAPAGLRALRRGSERSRALHAGGGR